jgi:hypothetical protein
MNDIRGKCDLLRSDCKYMESVARDLMKSKVFISFAETFEGQHDEMKAQIMLAVRHLEDARMRLGKVLQYSRDGVSILDSPQEAKP